MLLKLLLPLLLITAAVAQPPQVDWQIVSVKTMQNLGAIVPPGTVDHVNVLVRPDPKRWRKVSAVMVTVIWSSHPPITKVQRFDPMFVNAAMVSIDIPAGADPKPASIVVSELSISAKPLEVKP